jgi:hypothetical protein
MVDQNIIIDVNYIDKSEEEKAKHKNKIYTPEIKGVIEVIKDCNKRSIPKVIIRVSRPSTVEFIDEQLNTVVTTFNNYNLLQKVAFLKFAKVNIEAMDLYCELYNAIEQYKKEGRTIKIVLGTLDSMDIKKIDKETIDKVLLLKITNV